MCLTVEMVPASKSDGLLVPCRKKLEPKEFVWTYGGIEHCPPNTYQTPFQNTMIPDDGWLIPERKSATKAFYEGMKIGSNFIHAANMSYNNDVYEYLHSNRGKNAYAFGVEAYGVRNDLICRAMFIPVACRDKNLRRETRAKIDHLLSMKRLTRPLVIEQFPHLAKILNTYSGGVF